MVSDIDELSKYFSDVNNVVIGRNDRSHRVTEEKINMHVYQESFLNIYDAETYVEGLMDSYRDTEYVMRECKIVYLVGRWLAAASFEVAQGDLFE